ncbi:MAG: aspartate aminotransferase family protein [Gammaproteobacteria bacterium]|nr:aspartate aminotransferase family protein [Gammaproteobacteria bacterium]MCY4339657.1 aspartate aminotransferase family protein [Gammaproteobacteria bacterium]
MPEAIMATYRRLDVAFASGRGAWLTDQAGARYLDALSGIAVCGLGHAHPAVAEALAEQAGRLVHTSNLYRIPLQEELAERLTEVTGMERVFFCNSGAEANEAALKICRKFARHKQVAEPLIIAMTGSFHGRTMATLSATGKEEVRAGFEPLLPGFLHVPYNDLSALQLPEAVHARVVAVMLEAIQGEGGVNVPTPGYLRALRELCRRNGWLLVLDEVQTGMGRTGAWCAYQHEAILPEVVTLAKSLGNGVPIGACLAGGAAADMLQPGSHGSTFGGNPLAAAAALAVIRTLREQHLVEHAATCGAAMLARFREQLGAIDGVVAIRGKGLMLGIELERDCGVLVEQALQRRLLLNVTAGKVVRLLPPLVITEQEADQIVATVCLLVKEFCH